MIQITVQVVETVQAIPAAAANAAGTAATFVGEKITAAGHWVRSLLILVVCFILNFLNRLLKKLRKSAMLLCIPLRRQSTGKILRGNPPPRTLLIAYFSSSLTGLAGEAKAKGRLSD